MLSRGLNQQQIQYTQFQFISADGAPVVSHLSHADDILIFCNGSTTSLKRRTEFLERYQEFSGQHVNPTKLGFITVAKKPLKISLKKSITNFQRVEFPFNYLRCPIYEGKLTRRIFAPLIASKKIGRLERKVIICWS